MEKNKIKYKNKYEFKIRILSVQEIDAIIFGNSLIHFSEIIEIIGSKVNSDLNSVLKIKGINKGSIDYELAIICSLISPQIIDYAANIFQIFVGFLDFKKFLNGKEYKKVSNINGKVAIKNNKNVEKIVGIENLNIFIDSKINNSSVAAFQQLNKEPKITGLEVIDKNNQDSICLDKSDLTNFAKDSEIVNTTLNILSISFNKNAKSDFIYNENKIRAKILDDKFNTKISNGEPFAKGDSLEVVLKISKKFDESANAFVVKSYEILKVIEHLKKGQKKNNLTTFGGEGKRKLML